MNKVYLYVQGPNLSVATAGGALPPPPGAGGPPPPPPPAVLPPTDAPKPAGEDGDTTRANLFASLNKGADITKGMLILIFRLCICAH